MTQLRTPADKLEMMVDKKFWPFPSYGDLMFEVQDFGWKCWGLIESAVFDS